MQQNAVGCSQDYANKLACNSKPGVCCRREDLDDAQAGRETGRMSEMQDAGEASRTGKVGAFRVATCCRCRCGCWGPGDKMSFIDNASQQPGCEAGEGGVFRGVGCVERKGGGVSG